MKHLKLRCTGVTFRRYSSSPQVEICIKKKTNNFYLKVFVWLQQSTIKNLVFIHYFIQDKINKRYLSQQKILSLSILRIVDRMNANYSTEGRFGFSEELNFIRVFTIYVPSNKSNQTLTLYTLTLTL